jgi:vacuolar-type H+-ATPase subunit I/STV1
MWLGANKREVVLEMAATSTMLKDAASYWRVYRVRLVVNQIRVHIWYVAYYEDQPCSYVPCLL